MSTADIVVGMYVQYSKAPDTPLLVISTPYEYAGQWCVTARRGCGGQGGGMVGMYAVEALAPWPVAIMPGGVPGIKPGARPGKGGRRR